MNAVLIPGNVSLCVCAGPGALHFSVWRCFAGLLLAEAEGVPGIFAEGGLGKVGTAEDKPSGCLTSIRSLAAVPRSCS